MTAPRHRVAVLVSSAVIPFELGIASRVFGMARDATGQRLYEVVTCATEPGRIRTTSDFDIHVDTGTEALTTADTVIIPASYDLDLCEDEARLASVRRALDLIRPGTRIASICTGAFLLAAAGLLDGRRATTHWMHTADLRRRFPSVTVDRDVLFVDDGDILTSAGVAAGLDLCLHMVRSDHGTEVANSVARRNVVPPYREGGQVQFIERPMPEPGAASTAAAREWALRHLERPLSLEELAGHCAMSVRTFSRRFRDETGMTPGQWLIGQRVNAALRMLESTDLTTTHIAVRCGFGTTASMRRHLRAEIGVSPAAYRKTFQSALPRKPSSRSVCQDHANHLRFHHLRSARIWRTTLRPGIPVTPPPP